MRAIPTAIGYLRTDVSGIRQTWDETQIRSLAGKLGYNYLKLVAFSNATLDPLERLATLARRLDVDAVVTPSLEHVGGQVPELVVAAADVITVSPQKSYARWASGRVDLTSTT